MSSLDKIADIIPKDSPQYEVDGLGQKIEPKHRVLATRVVDYLSDILFGVGWGVATTAIYARQTCPDDFDQKWTLIFGIGGALAGSLGLGLRATTAICRGAVIKYEKDYKGLKDFIRRI